jgi:hypothetical protein
MSLSFGTLRVAWKVSKEFPPMLEMVIATPLDFALSSPSADCFSAIPLPPVYNRQDNIDCAAIAGELIAMSARNMSVISFFIAYPPV